MKKNAQGEIISREIKLVPIEDEASTSAETSVLNQGRVQVVKKSVPVTAGSGNRSVISPNKSTEAGNRAVIRIGTDSEDSEEGDRRNVISQQPTGRVSVQAIFSCINIKFSIDYSLNSLTALRLI